MANSSTAASKPVSQKSPKQRLKLVINHYAEVNLGRKGLFTNEEAKQIAHSFREGKEMDLYNKAIESDKRTKHALLLMGNFVLSYREAITNLIGYVLLWESYQRSQGLFNLLLNNVQDDERARLRKLLIDNAFLLFATLEEEPKSADRVHISINHQARLPDSHSLSDMLTIWKKHSEELIRKVKAISIAIGEYMFEQDFRPTAYQKMLKDFLDEIHEDRAPLPKYSRKGIENWKSTINDADFEEKLIREMGGPDLEKYLIFPDPDNLEIDKDFYQQFKKEHLS